MVLFAMAALGALAADSVRRCTPGSPPQFQFARMVYVDLPQNANFRRGWWQQDWPEAEDHFVHNLRRLTRVDAGESVTVRLTDENLFDYPWLYATQVGLLGPRMMRKSRAAARIPAARRLPHG